MESTRRVECPDCGRRFHVYDSCVPCDVEEGEAFPCECPFCEQGEGRYAVLVISEKTQTAKRK